MLAEIPKMNIQSIPSGYFENLEERISIYALLNQEDIKQDLNQDKTNIPSGYFENLSDSILFKVKELESKEVEETFPELNSLKNIQVFKVPEGYFENLSERILSNIPPKEKAKVISITGRTWWKYMAAALIAGIILFSAFYFLNIGGNNVSPYLTAANQYKTSAQLIEGFESLNEDAIIKYLESNSNITDNDLLLNSIETDELPDEVDYLIDDNALNNYLNKINI